MRLLIVLLLSGCAGQTSFELALGKELSGNWEGDGPVVDAAIRRANGKTFCEIRHTSNLLSGRPFNRDFENTVTRASCGLKLGR